jgi:phosphoglycolate phosphatase
LIGPPLRDYLPSLLNVTEEECLMILDAFRTHHDTEGFLAYRLYPDAEAVLAQLADSGHPLYAATNKPFALSSAALRHFGLLEQFQNVYCPDGSLWPSGLPSHAKSTVLANLKQFSDPYDVVYVGDTESDRNSAVEAGVDFIHAGYGYGSGIQAKRHIDTLSGLLTLIR